MLVDLRLMSWLALLGLDWTDFHSLFEKIKAKQRFQLFYIYKTHPVMAPIFCQEVNAKMFYYLPHIKNF